MNCERCGLNPAQIQYTEIRDGRQKKMRICPTCASELGFGEEESGSAAPSTAAAGGGPTPSHGFDPSDPETRVCPACGLPGKQLRSESQFGCPTCYETFAETLPPLLRRLHGAVLHRGRLPGGRTVGAADVSDLERRLARALEDEDYEEAARLRDRLRAAARSRRSEGSGSDGPSRGSAS